MLQCAKMGVGRASLALTLLLALMLSPASNAQSSKEIPSPELLARLGDQDLERANAAWFELLRRREIPWLTSLFDRDEPNQENIVMLLYHMGQKKYDERIVRFMRAHLGKDLSRHDFYIALFLAERGDLPALETLSNNCYQYGMSSMDWANGLVQFGKYRYRPAIPCLVWCVNAVSLNAADAAIQSLELFFPKTVEQRWTTLAELQDRYEKVAGIDLDAYIKEFKKRHPDK